MGRPLPLSVFDFSFPGQGSLHLRRMQGLFISFARGPPVFFRPTFFFPPFFLQDTHESFFFFRLVRETALYRISQLLD